MTHTFSDRKPSGSPRFRPTLHALDDRLTPALAFATSPFALGAIPTAVAVADVDGDGRLDVVTANRSDNSVSVLRNTTAKWDANTPSNPTTFAPAVTVAVGSQPIAVAAGDFNRDGRIDIATANTGEDTVSVLVNVTPFGGTTPAFAALPFKYFVGSQPTDLAVADFNNDGYADIAATNGGSNTVSVLLNVSPNSTAQLQFRPAQSLTVGAAPNGLVAADLYNDGTTDIVTVNGDGTVSVLFNASPTGPPVGAYALNFLGFTATTVAGANGIASGDFDGDGGLDLAVSSGTGGTVTVLPNPIAYNTDVNPPNPFSIKATFAVGATPTAVAVGDFDGDGRSDIAARLRDGPLVTMVRILRNTTAPGTSTPAFDTPTLGIGIGLGPTAIAVGDFNDDGRIDFVFANNTIGSAAVAVAVNKTTDPLLVGAHPVVGVIRGYGVMRFNRVTNSWESLTGAVATTLATAANGNVVGSFGGNGVWYYRPTVGWTKIHAAEATALAVDDRGNVYASLTGVGTARYGLVPSFAGQVTGWITLTGVQADLLVANGSGTVAASFARYGTYILSQRVGWELLNGNAATALAIGANGDVAAAFAGYGTYSYNRYLSWRLVDRAEATTLAVGPGGTVTAVFAGSWVQQYDVPGSGFGRTLPRPFSSVSPPDSLAFDLFGHLTIRYADGEVMEYNPFSGWTLLPALPIAVP